MPQASDEMRALWGIDDYPPTAYLKAAGFTLNRDWTWTPPAPDHELTGNERSAIRFLIDEWDFGGLVRLTAEEQQAEAAADSRLNRIAVAIGRELNPDFNWGSSWCMNARNRKHLRSLAQAALNEIAAIKKEKADGVQS